MDNIEQKFKDIETIVNSLLNGDDVLVKGDGYKYHVDAHTILGKWAAKLTDNQIRETAQDINRYWGREE